MFAIHAVGLVLFHRVLFIRREISEKMVKFAQELSTAQMVAEQAVKRADAAEELQKLMANDIEEARVVQQYNGQLHKYVFY